MNLPATFDESCDAYMLDETVAPESLLNPMEFTTAETPHACGYNSSHWLDQGMARLTIRSNDDEHHYCLACARTLLIQGTEQLRIFLAGLNGLSRA